MRILPRSWRFSPSFCGSQKIVLRQYYISVIFWHFTRREVVFAQASDRALATNNDAHFAQMAIKNLLQQLLSFAPLQFLHTIFIFFCRKSQGPYSHRPKLSAAIQPSALREKGATPRKRVFHLALFPLPAVAKADDMLPRIPKAGRLYLSIRTFFFTSSMLFQIEATARWRTLVVTQQ